MALGRSDSTASLSILTAIQPFWTFDILKRFTHSAEVAKLADALA